MPRRSFLNLLGTLVMLLVQGKCLSAVAQSGPPKVTVCEVAKNPDQFDNQIVELKATLAGNFEISAVRDPINAMVPTQPRPEVVLRKDDVFRQFQTLVDARM
jgi:hypothetical protein